MYSANIGKVRAGHYVRFTVADTGTGIPPEVRAKIFDPFFTTKDPGEGTGLGLALCYGIVQDMSGTMKVESTVNVGTRFTIELPLASATPAALISGFSS